MGKIVIHGMEFPDKCPDNCPDKHYMEHFDQGITCIRCPIFNCQKFPYKGTMQSMIEPEHYPEDIAKSWYEWFKESGCLEDN